MDGFNGIDLSNISIPQLNIDTSAITRQFEQQNAAIQSAMNATYEHKRKMDAALLETAEASIAQKELLSQQLNEVKEQNQLLKDNYSTLKELYETTKSQVESSNKEARNNKIFGWVSFAVGTIIGIAGVVIGIII